MRVLVAEDEQILADSIAELLRREAFAVDVAYDGDAALERLGATEYDVVVLDRNLPVVHGDEICRAITDSGAQTRILMVTAAAAVRERVAGLAIGADDYLTKPFAFVELAARVHALARRTRPAPAPILEWDGLRLDPARHEAFRDGRPLTLSRKELGLLAELMHAGGAVVSHDRLLAKVWDARTDPFTNAVRVTMMKLRRKLGDPPLVETVPGAGYRLS